MQSKAPSVMAPARTRKARGAPPRPPAALSAGITGHRVDSLPPDSLPQLHERIRDALQLIAESATGLTADNGDCFSPAPAVHRFVSPLADGADQVAADVALELGWELQAILPFARGTYRASLANEEGRERFDALLARASRTLELPGSGPDDVEGYVMAGRATIAHCDVLIAVWDGLPPRGRGGTGEVVQLALTSGTAVIHLPPDPALEARLLWSGFDPTVLTLADDPACARPLDRAHTDMLLRKLLMPPAEPQERAFLTGFFKERKRWARLRVEYPLLLAVTGIKKFRPRSFTDKSYSAMVQEEWRTYREGCVDAHNIVAPFDILEEAYSWSDRLATHFAQTYRSGHIFNFVLGGIAVCMGLGAFMAPHLKLQEAVLEMIITVLIILNAHIGTKQEWHRRWLDYRQLAERLRPMRTLKLLGIAAPDPPGTETDPTAVRWIEWYSNGIWRAMGCPSASIDAACAMRLGRAIAEYEVEPQVSYHERHAKQIEMLDHRLEKVATILFTATLVVSVATIVGYAINPAFVNTYGNWFTLISAGFPALGTAVFGIRFQADFGGDAVRSEATGQTLGQIDAALRNDVTLSRAADLAEQASRVMLSDLDEWQLVNQQRDLSVG